MKDQSYVIVKGTKEKNIFAGYRLKLCVEYQYVPTALKLIAEHMMVSVENSLPIGCKEVTTLKELVKLMLD